MALPRHPITIRVMPEVYIDAIRGLHMEFIHVAICWVAVQGCPQSPLFRKAPGIGEETLQEAELVKEELATTLVPRFRLSGLVRMADQARAGLSSRVTTGVNADDHRTQGDADP